MLPAARGKLLTIAFSDSDTTVSLRQGSCAMPPFSDIGRPCTLCGAATDMPKLRSDWRVPSDWANGITIVGYSCDNL
jgi:hypothetical protein